MQLTSRGNRVRSVASGRFHGAPRSPQVAQVVAARPASPSAPWALVPQVQMWPPLPSTAAAVVLAGRNRPSESISPGGVFTGTRSSRCHYRQSLSRAGVPPPPRRRSAFTPSSPEPRCQPQDQDAAAQSRARRRCVKPATMAAERSPPRPRRRALAASTEGSHSIMKPEVIRRVLNPTTRTRPRKRSSAHREKFPIRRRWRRKVTPGRRGTLLPVWPVRRSSRSTFANSRLRLAK